MTRYHVIHTETGVIVGRFDTYRDARYWLDHLGVTPQYKERCYRISEVNA